MENNFNNNIKQSFENYELPYDSAAWDQLSKKLDVHLPVKGKPNYKLWIAASILTLATISTFIVATSTYVENPTTASTKNSKKESKSTPENISTTSNAIVVKENNKKVENSINEIISNSTPIVISNTTNASKLSESKIKTSESIEEVYLTKDNKMNNSTLTFQSMKDVCPGDDIEISNSNNSDIIVLFPNDKKATIKGNTKTDFKALIPGEYSIGYMKNNVYVSKETFIVHSAKPVEFSIDNDNIYTEGVPTINLKANSTAASYNWTFESLKTSSQAKEVDVQFYKAGTYKVTLTTTNENGCNSSETNKVTIKSDYNLISPDVINLSDENSKNKTFIPYALTVRNVKFKMYIMDAMTGVTIYETDDANQPWDGTDSRTGNKVNGSNYIWKVVLINPLPNENANYKGVITRL